MEKTEDRTLDRSAGTEARTVRHGLSLGPSGSILLAVSFAAALWFSFGHDWLSPSFHGPGIGLTVSHLLLAAAAIFTAKKQRRLKFTPEGIFLLALSVLLSASYAVFANAVLKRLSMPVLFLITAQALFSLTGQNSAPTLSGNGLWEGLRRYGDSLFRYWKAPFASLSARSRSKAGNSHHVLFGLTVALLASVIAAAILASADQVFFEILIGAARRAANADVTVVPKLLLAPVLALLLFSHRFSLLQSPRVIAPASARASDPTVVSLVLIGLSLVYALFGYVQIRYLFAGVESVRMSGGYAAYARSGFFQLVLLATLTLAVILPVLTLFKKSRIVRALCALTSLLTGIIDVSAFVRMRLYTEAYGLSTLRVITLWGIAIILLALLAAMAKAVRPEWRICPLLAAVILTSWVALNWINVDRVVANNQVARFNEAPEGSSVEALASDRHWSPEYYAAFEGIADPKARREALALLAARGREASAGGRRLDSPSPYDWSLAYLRMDGKQP